MLNSIFFPWQIVGIRAPAQVRGEHVEHLVLGDDRMERRSVGPVDHVALVRCPPVQRAAGKHTGNSNAVFT